jgi:hypothetical protein
VVWVGVKPDARWASAGRILICDRIPNKDSLLLLLFAWRRQGDVDSRCSTAEDRDGTGLGSHRSAVWVGVERVAC